MRELAFGRTQEEEGGFCTEVNPINRNHYQRAAPTNLRFDPLGIFQYRPHDPVPSRDLFVAALEAEGIPCDGRFYEPVYRSDLFYARPENCPQLALNRPEPMDYSQCLCPVSERAAYNEAVWLPQFLLLGDGSDTQDVIRAIEKVVAGSAELAKADPKLAGIKACSRALRAKMERMKNY